MSAPTIINFDVDDAVWIGGEGISVKTPAALQAVMVKLQQMGYEVDDRHSRDDTSQLAAFASYPRTGKCGSCGSYISTVGIRKHGHTCEVCGKVTHYDIVEGSVVRFTFRSDNHTLVENLCMGVVRWDSDGGYLYLNRTPRNDGSVFDYSGAAAESYLTSHSDEWDLVQENGLQLVRVRYSVRPPRGRRENDTIDMQDIRGEYSNCSIVRLYNDREYHELDQLPIPEMISIYATY